MKTISLLFVLSVVAVMSVLLAAMATDASAQAATAAKPQAPNVISATVNASRSALVSVAGTSFDTPAAKADTARKNVKKRSRSKCARITGTCWSGS